MSEVGMGQPHPPPGRTVAIDLGCTNCRVCYLDEAGNPVLVRDKQGRDSFPAVVWSAGKEQGLVVGYDAAARIGTHPSPATGVLRKLGIKEMVSLGGEIVSPVDVTAELLLHARRLVETTTGEKVAAVVMTIPAYFNAAARHEIKMAASRAFDAAENRIELILAPVAATYAYIAEEPANRLLTLVYDLGGSSFDVTVLETERAGGTTILGFDGDPQLGGDNVDNRLAAWISDRLRTTYELDLDGAVPEAMVRVHKLKLLAELAKKNLTAANEVAVVAQSVFADDRGDLVDIDLRLTRREQDHLISEIVGRTISGTLAAVEKSGRRPSDFDRVLLAGGCSRMPVITEELSKIFSCPIQLADPESAVVRGAAMRMRFFGTSARADEVTLSLEYPRRTEFEKVAIDGHLAEFVNDCSVYLIDEHGGELIAPVAGGRFALTDVELRPGENRFHLEVVDASERQLASADVSILRVVQAALACPPDAATLATEIGIRDSKGFRVLFPGGQLLPAQTVIDCFWNGSEPFFVIPIYSGERLLCNLRSDDVTGLRAGESIRLSIRIEQDLHLRASIESPSRWVRSLEVPIVPDPLRIEEERNKTLEEIEIRLETIWDPAQRLTIARKLRRIESEFASALREVCPDQLVLFHLLDELRLLQTEVENSEAVLEPTLREFADFIRGCRDALERMPTHNEASLAALDSKILLLERLGKDAWDAGNGAAWKEINNEARETLNSLEKAFHGASPSIVDTPPALIREELMHWLAEMANVVHRQRLQSEFEPAIERVRRELRSVDLSPEGEARQHLLSFVAPQIQQLNVAIKKAWKPDVATNEGAALRRKGREPLGPRKQGVSEVPTDRIDKVHFAVTIPPTVQPGLNFFVDIWAHLESHRIEVERRIRQAVAQTSPSPLIRTKGPFAIARGTTLHVRLEFGDLAVESSEDVILWDGEIGTASFVVAVPSDASEGPKSCQISVYWEGCFRIASVPLQIMVAPSLGSAVPIKHPVERLHTAFASYASEDRDEVLHRIQGMQKVIPDLKVFLDVVNLRSGDDWEAELWRVIPGQDVFYLFWSRNAKQSSWVEKEWRCALKTRGLAFIDPVPLESPDVVDPPEELKKKHFNDWILAYRRSKSPFG